MRPSFFLINVFASYFAIVCSQNLYLSPFINNGSIAEAQKLSIVDPELLEFDIKSHSGFITVDEKYNSNLWFWYFPAGKVDTKIAPFILWLQGGPGYSSLKGLFEGVGPFGVNSDGTVLTENPFSWHNDHNLLFIDNPVGTGFSFTNHSDGYATNQDQIAKQLYKFLVQFLRLFPELKQVPMYLCGQSYGGKHVPSLANEIHQNNLNSKFKINLKGIAIGNGFYDPPKLGEKYAKYLYELGFIDDLEMEKDKETQDEFQEAMEDGDYLKAEMKFFSLLQNLKVQKIDAYDFTKDVEIDWMNSIQKFTDRININMALHTDDIFFHHSFYVREKLGNDMMKSGKHWLEKALDNYKTLLYSGHLDLVCPYSIAVSTHKTLKWSGSEKYTKVSRAPWYFSRQLVGYSKKVDNMLEVLIRNAGHDVSKDQPMILLLLIKSFINDIPLNDEY